MTPGRLDLEVPRNGSDWRILQLFTFDVDGKTEIPLDVTGFTFVAKARGIFGGAVIATAAVAIDSAVNGKVSVRWTGSQFDAFGDARATAIAAWDLKMIDDGGAPSVPARGILYITPEATA